MSRTTGRIRLARLQAHIKREPATARRIETEAHAATVAASLRAMMRYSTDPAWLEKMAQEVESKAHRRT